MTADSIVETRHDIGPAMQATFKEDHAMKILVLSDLHLELGTSLTATRIPGSITWGAGAAWAAISWDGSGARLPRHRFRTSTKP